MAASLEKIFILDFYGQNALPVAPPVNTARMGYDAANNSMFIFDSSGNPLAGTSNHSGTHVVLEINKATYIDFYGMENAPFNPPANQSSAFYDSVVNHFTVIDHSGTVLLGTSSGAAGGREVQLHTKCSVIDFFGSKGSPGNPPFGFCRMFYDSNANAFHVIDHSGNILL